MKKKRIKEARIFGMVALVAFGATVLFSVFCMSSTVKEISEVAISKTPTAILASAGVMDGRKISIPVLYYDQKADDCVNIYDDTRKAELEARQFEWTECGYLNKKIENGLVEFELDDKFIPVAVGGQLLPNRGLRDMTRWFSTVEGKSASYAGTLSFDYDADGAVFSFYKEKFYPLDDVEFDRGGVTNRDGHNHLFTMSFAAPFTALFSGEESFEITADDDTFVFVGNKLVIDMGGVHDASTGSFQIRENGDIYASVDGMDWAYSGVTLNKEDGSIVRVFHADRDSSDSTIDVRFSGMNLAVVDTKIADDGTDNITVAYDPSNPSYVAPLGESKVFKPNGTKGLIIMATIEGVVLIVFSIFTVIMIKFLLMSKRKL